MQQIREKHYPDSVLHYTGDILLVAINYDKNSKKHPCLMEKYEKKELGTNDWRIVSTERIMLKKQYQVPILLYIGTRVESRFISPPQPGKFLSDFPHTLREICYISER